LSVVRPDEPLGRRTTLRVGGHADLYVEPASEADLKAVVVFCQEHGLPLLVLGRGSNLLVRDGGVRGLVVALAQPVFCGIEVRGALLDCGAGARLKEVAAVALQHGLGGLEFLEGIPGSVGGALRMNAGAMGFRAGDVVETVRVMDRSGGVSERAASTLPFVYRGCPFFAETIALRAVWRGQPAPPHEIRSRLAEFSGRRWASQPREPSAGCLFKNPAEAPAGKLIDALGLKGLRVGGATISEVHANFLVTEQGATAHDVLELAGIVRERVRRERGIALELEVQVVGEDD
jgi:UDP-N-acetylenolpyruvoylglucosamine reductase